MWNKVEILSIFISLLVLTFSVGYLLSNHITKNKMQDMRTNDERLAMQISTSLATEGTSLDGKTMVKDTNGKNVLLTSLIKEETFVIYFTKLDCMACIDRELRVLDEFFDKEDLRKRVLLIGNFDNKREQKLLERNTRIKTYQVKGSSFFSSFKNEKSILYCLVDSNLAIHNCMDVGTIRSNIDVARIYYKTISDRFKKDGTISK